MVQIKILKNAKIIAINEYFIVFKFVNKILINIIIFINSDRNPISIELSIGESKLTINKPILY